MMDISNVCSAPLSPDNCSCPLNGDSAEFSSTEKTVLLSHRFLEECNKKYSIPKKTARHVQVCSDEIMTNIVSYAHADTICIRYGISDNAVILTFEDDGILYDPLQSKAPDVTLATRERQIGGLGLFLVKKISRSVEYVAVNGRNRLQLVIDLPPDLMTE